MKKKLPDPEDYKEKTTKMQNKILERKKKQTSKKSRIIIETRTCTPPPELSRNYL